MQPAFSNRSSKRPKSWGLTGSAGDSVDGFGKKGKSRVAFCLLFSSLMMGSFTGFLSCTEEYTIPQVQHQIVVLQVNYLTHQFEGGKIYNLVSAPFITDTMPVSISYQPPIDFGAITLVYIPNNDTIFNATMIWKGNGKIKVPSCFVYTGFEHTSIIVPKPDTSKMKYLLKDVAITGNADYSTAWNAICDLKTTSAFINNDGKAAVFLYTPSFGIGDHSDWHWYFLLYK